MRILALAGLLASSLAFGQTTPNVGAQPGTAPAAKAATVTVNTSGSGSTIPANFVGLSGEVGDFVNGFYQGTSGTWTSNSVTGNAASFISLMNLLGSAGTFRLGGGSADTGSAPSITSGMSTNLNSFLGGLGASWTAIYTLDAVANDSATATTTVSNLTTAIGVNNIVFQIGNEPSLNGFTAATYETRWNAYNTAITASVASAKFAAIDDEFNFGWGDPVTVANALTPTLSGMQFLSQHWYSFCRNTFTSPVPSFLLSSVLMNANSVPSTASSGWFSAANQGFAYLAKQGLTGSVKQRMSETNSICARGQTGMSDRLMASTWFLNLAIILANNGWAGMNVHEVWTGGVGVYNPAIVQADQNFAPGTVFYGMYLFAKIEGQQILPSSVGGNGNVVALATKGGNGNANIIAVNNDISSPVAVTPAQAASWTTATVLQIKGGAGCAEANPTIGGKAIGESGAWSGSSFSINNGQAVNLGPCESALIQIQP